MSDATDTNPDIRHPPPSWATAIERAARAVGPPLLFGLPLWAAVSLALYVAFRLELDNAYFKKCKAAGQEIFKSLKLVDTEPIMLGAKAK